MKNIALKMKNKEAAACLTIWKISQHTDKFELASRQRGEAICKRVGMRMLNKDLSDRYMIWSSSWREYASEERGKQIMKRVGARMRMAEVVEAFGNWHGSASSGILEMVRVVWAVSSAAAWHCAECCRWWWLACVCVWVWFGSVVRCVRWVWFVAVAAEDTQFANGEE